MTIVSNMPRDLQAHRITERQNRIKMNMTFKVARNLNQGWKTIHQDGFRPNWIKVDGKEFEFEENKLKEFRGE